VDRKQMSIVVISVSFVLLAATCVTASPWTRNTPLYTFRMEQASSKMNFLPTAVNGFIYTTEKGHDLGHNAAECCGCGGAQPLAPYTCATCNEEMCEVPTICGTCGTCYWMTTCHPNTCPWTDWPLCYETQRYPTCHWSTCYWPGC